MKKSHLYINVVNNFGLTGINNLYLIKTKELLITKTNIAKFHDNMIIK